jgi:Tol biopolymer transport system component
LVNKEADLHNKALIQLVSILLTIVIIFGGLWLIIRRQAATPTPTDSPGSIEQEANLQTGEILIGSDKWYFPKVINNGETIIGLTDQGRYFTSFDWQTKQITQVMDQPLSYAPDSISYAPDGSAAITRRNANLSLEILAQTSLYDFKKGTITELNTRISEVVWPDSQHILYIFTKDDGTPQLVEANPDGTNWQVKIEQLSIQNPQLSLSPNGQRVTISGQYQIVETEDPNTDQTLFYRLAIFDRSSGWQELLPKGIISPIWTPDSQKLAYLRIKPEDGLGHLATLDLVTQDEHDTGLISLPGKFTWVSTNTLIVASPDPPSPEELVDGITLASRDKLYLVTLDNSQTQKLTTIITQPPLEDLMVVDSGKTIIFRRADFLIEQTLPNGKE